MTCVSCKAVTQVVFKELEKGSNLNNTESHLRNSKATVHNSLQGHTRIQVCWVYLTILKCKLILSGYVELRKGSPRNAIIEKTSLELNLYEHDLEGGSLEPWFCYQDSLKKRKELGWTEPSVKD